RRRLGSECRPKPSTRGTVATAWPDPDVRVWPCPGVFRVRSLRRAHGNALRNGEYQSVVVFPDGERVDRGGAGDAGRAPGAGAVGAAVSCVDSGNSGALLGRAGDGRAIGTRPRAVLGARDGR